MRIKSFSSMVGKIVMTMVFAAMIGGIYIAPAFGKDGDDRRGYNTQEVGTSKVGMSTGTTSVDGTYLVPTTTPNLFMHHHRSSMSRLRRQASASSSPSIFGRESFTSTAQRSGPRHSKTEPKPFAYVRVGHIIRMPGDKQKRGERMRESLC